MSSDPTNAPSGEHPEYGSYPTPQNYPPAPPPGYVPGAYPPPGSYPPPGYPPVGYTPPGYAGYPPPPNYAYPMSGAAPTGVAAPAGFGGLFEKFRRVLTRPSRASFANELPTANWGDVWLALLLVGVIVALTTYIQYLFPQVYYSPYLRGLSFAQRRYFSPYLRPTPLTALLDIITVPLGFFIGMAILWVCARIFRGSGSYLQQSYAFMLYYAPIHIATAVLSLVPIVGGLLSAALGIYAIVLATLALAASQRLSIGRAIGALLLPVIVVSLLLCGLVVLIVLALRGHSFTGLAPFGLL